MSAATLSDQDTSEIQRVVLCAPRAARVRHIVATFCSCGAARQFLLGVVDRFPATPVSLDGQGPAKVPLELQVSIGFSFRGLDELGAPAPVLANFQAGAPAFARGAPLRSAKFLGDHGDSAASGWHEAFGLDAAHGVISLHSNDRAVLETATAWIEAAARIDDPAGRDALATLRCFDGARLNPPAGQAPEQTWVHFGLRDGLSRVALRGWNDDRERADGQPGPDKDTQLLDTSRHEVGEFLLGHPNDLGYNPWVLADARPPVREFFRNASFGVLRIMEQKEKEFRQFVERSARELQRQGVPAPGMSLAETEGYVKAKMSGRWPNGDRFVGGAWHQRGQVKPEADFDYQDDEHGFGCPFGSHVRRMNPRVDPNGHAGRGLRRRPLIRRGMPYGPAYEPGDENELETQKPEERGLLGLFFCASIEDQFEHLVGQWGERVPLGSGDRGQAKDPLAGNHEDPQAVFEIPRPDALPLALKGFAPFTRTRGTVYLFYPGLSALRELLCGELSKRLWDDELELRRS